MKFQKTNRAVRATLLILTSLGLLAPAVSGADGAKTAYDYLAGAIVGQDDSFMVISSFHAIDDKELTPVFVALSRCGDKKKRLLATTALGQLGGPQAVAALKQQLSEDSVMAVRAAALVHLLNLKSADPTALSAATKIKDQNIQCIAARSLATASKDSKHLDLARTTLKKLTESNETTTRSMASLGLLAMGDGSQMDGLKKLLSDPQTETTILRLAMLQIVDEKITAAAPLAQIVIDSTKRSVQTRILACRALAASSKKSAPLIFAALRKSPSMLFRIPAMGVLSQQNDADRYLAAIAKSTLPIGPLAAFELARKTPGPSTSKTVEKALAIRHPIAMNHVFGRAAKDIDKLGPKANFYAAPLAKFIESVEPDTDRMTHEHLLAAQAATLLADLGTPAAIGCLDKILRGRYSAITRSTAAGLLRAKNRAVLPIARKLLADPYPELATYGALTLGHFSDPAAADHFQRIVTRQTGHTVAEVALSCWYLLKIKKQSARSATQLAKLIK